MLKHFIFLFAVAAFAVSVLAGCANAAPVFTSGDQGILPKIVLTGSTTSDAKSVTVCYTISQANVIQPLRFDVYRADGPSVDTGARLIGTQIVDPLVDPTDMAVGAHRVTLIAGTALVPDTKLPYIVVVANSDKTVGEDAGSVNRSWFRTWLLGVVVHGYAYSQPATLAWVSSMAQDLTAIDHFDHVVQFDWTTQSTAADSGETAAAGVRLNKQIADIAQSMAIHGGDVVDIHFIGHSRGTVVISQTLQNFVKRTEPCLIGSYVEVTLLDIHPANPSEDSLLSSDSGGLGTAGLYEVDSFQDAADDPEVLFPAGAGVMSVDIWWQHSSHTEFPKSGLDSILNLWGESESDNKVTNNTGVTIQWNDLTSQWTPQLGTIGHLEISEYYRRAVADTGTLH